MLFGSRSARAHVDHDVAAEVLWDGRYLSRRQHDRLDLNWRAQAHVNTCNQSSARLDTPWIDQRVRPSGATIAVLLVLKCAAAP